MQISRLCSVLLAQALIACSAETVPANPASSSPASTAQSGTGGPAVAPRAPGNTGGTTSSAVGVGTPENAPAAASCPSLRPVEDSTCSVSPTLCSYDEIECGCPSGTWSCAEPVDPNCPATMPMHASPCSVPEGTECEFLQDECACMSGRWSCEAFELDDAGVAQPPTTPPPTMPADAGMSTTPPPASTETCPDLRPIEGFSCMIANRTCRYDTTSCVCPMGSWLCSESVDPACPIEPPTPGNPCMGAADCDYFNIECECRLSSWTCKAND